MYAREPVSVCVDMGSLVFSLLFEMGGERGITIRNGEGERGNETK